MHSILLMTFLGSIATTVHTQALNADLLVQPISADCRPIFKEIMPKDKQCGDMSILMNPLSTAAELETQMPLLCGSECTSLVSAGFTKAMESECSKNDTNFSKLTAIPYYYINMFCMTDKKDNCIVQQTKALEAVKILPNVTSDTWPKDILCSDCSKQVVSFTLNPATKLDGYLSIYNRGNPASNATNLAKVCGAPWMDAAKAQAFKPTVSIQAPAAPPSTPAAPGSSTDNKSKNNAVSSLHHSGILPVVGLAAMTAVLLF